MQGLRALQTPSHYVTISRGRRGIRIFTPDKEQLRENVTRSGHRPLAMELATGFVPRRGIRLHNCKGEVVAYAGRWLGDPPGDTPKYKLPTGFNKGQEVFNLDRALQETTEDPLVIVEGFFDAIELHQHGCRKVAALMGSTPSPGRSRGKPGPGCPGTSSIKNRIAASMSSCF